MMRAGEEVIAANWMGTPRVGGFLPVIPGPSWRAAPAAQESRVPVILSANASEASIREESRIRDSTRVRALRARGL